MSLKEDFESLRRSCPVSNEHGGIQVHALTGDGQNRAVVYQIGVPGGQLDLHVLREYDQILIRAPLRTGIFARGAASPNAFNTALLLVYGDLRCISAKLADAFVIESRNKYEVLQKLDRLRTLGIELLNKHGIEKREDWDRPPVLCLAHGDHEREVLLSSLDDINWNLPDPRFQIFPGILAAHQKLVAARLLASRGSISTLADDDAQRTKDQEWRFLIQELDRLKVTHGLRYDATRTRAVSDVIKVTLGDTSLVFRVHSEPDSAYLKIGLAAVKELETYSGELLALEITNHIPALRQAIFEHPTYLSPKLSLLEHVHQKIPGARALVDAKGEQIILMRDALALSHCSLGDFNSLKLHEMINTAKERLKQLDNARKEDPVETSHDAYTFQFNKNPGDTECTWKFRIGPDWHRHPTAHLLEALRFVYANPDARAPLFSELRKLEGAQALSPRLLDTLQSCPRIKVGPTGADGATPATIYKPVYTNGLMLPPGRCEQEIEVADLIVWASGNNVPLKSRYTGTLGAAWEADLQRVLPDMGELKAGGKVHFHPSLRTAQVRMEVTCWSPFKLELTQQGKNDAAIKPTTDAILDTLLFFQGTKEGGPSIVFDALCNAYKQTIPALKALRELESVFAWLLVRDEASGDVWFRLWRGNRWVELSEKAIQLIPSKLLEGLLTDPFNEEVVASFHRFCQESVVDKSEMRLGTHELNGGVGVDVPVRYGALNLDGVRKATIQTLGDPNYVPILPVGGELVGVGSEGTQGTAKAVEFTKLTDNEKRMLERYIEGQVSSGALARALGAPREFLPMGVSPQEQNKETTMTQPTTGSAQGTPRERLVDRITDSAKADATEAAWRLATKQLIKMTREPLVALLSRHLAPDDESVRKKLATFLETEMGTSMLAAVLAIGVTVVPAQDPRIAVLASQLRVHAMAGAADIVADLLMGPLRQVLAMYLQGGIDLPAHLPPQLPEGHSVNPFSEDREPEASGVR